MSASSATLSSAIVGVESWFDGLDDRVALEHAIYRGASVAFVATPIPELLPLCERLSISAVADARLATGSRLALLGAEEAGSLSLLQELRTRLGAVSVAAVGGGPMSFVQGLQQGDALLSAGKAEAVLLLSVDMSGVAGRRRGGAALVMVQRANLYQSRRAYALLESLAIVEATDRSFPSDEDIKWSVELAIGEAGVEGRDIGYVESGAAAFEGLAAGLRFPDNEPACAIGNAAAMLGPTSASAGFLQTVFALRHRYLPRSSASTVSSETPFFTSDESRPYFASPGRRRALMQVADGSVVASVLLAEHAAESPILPGYDPVAPLVLLPIAATDVAELLRVIEKCEARLASGTSPQALAAELATSARNKVSLAMAIVGRDGERLRAELNAARLGVPNTLASGVEWQTPGGSSFAPIPQGQEGKVAFVYPGAFSAYVGLARDAFRLFPWLYEPGHGLPKDLGPTFADSLLYPRFRGSPSADDRATAEWRLYEDHVGVFSASAAASVLYTRVVRDVFGVRADSSFGYSLGEGIMFSALKVWDDPDLQRERLQGSALFRTRLAGPREALRSFWQSRGVGSSPGPAPWATYVVKAPVDRVRAAVRSGRNVFLTIVNTPEEAVIGGLPEECKRVLADLQCEYVRAPFAQLLHSDVVASEEDEIARQHSFAVRSTPPINFYSATSEAPIALETDSLARTLARMAREPLDFPKLVDRVWNGGARVFLELGGGTTCSRLIATNLQGRPHVTIAIDRRGVDVQTSVVRCLARLFSHRVQIDLTQLNPIQEGVR